MYQEAIINVNNVPTQTGAAQLFDPRDLMELLRTAVPAACEVCYTVRAATVSGSGRQARDWDLPAAESQK